VSVSGGLTAEALLQIEGGASATDDLVERAGFEVVFSGGAASGDIVQSGGTLFLNSGATASDETVLSGGTLAYGGNLSGDLTVTFAPVTNATVLGPATVETVGVIELYDAVVLSGVTVSLGTETQSYDLSVSKGAVLQGAGFLEGEDSVAGSVGGVTVTHGELTLLSGGTASGVTAVLRATIQVNSGASATGTVVSSGGALLDYGTTTGTVTIGGGVADVYAAASGDIVESGGKEAIRSGGAASAVQVLSGGTLYVLASATATDTVVSGGGKEQISSGGVAVETTMLSGGVEYISSGGLANHGVVSSGGVEAIYSGGTAADLTLLSGGVVIDNGQVRVAGAGTLAGILSGSGEITQLGGGDLLISGVGAAFKGRAVISGGTIELATAGALGAGSVTFVEPTTGSAVLQIDAGDAPTAGGTFANVISNFSGANEDIDLRSIAFVAGATATVMGSPLVLSDGGNTYTFNIAGSTAGAYPVLSDGHGGTLIDPRAVAPEAIDPKVLAFAHTLTAFAPLDASRMALVSGALPGALTPFAHSIGSGGGAHF